MTNARTLARRAGLAAGFALALATSQANAAPLFSVKLYSHPNGEASANPNAVDNRDYGMRIDNSQGLNTFHFVDVSMSFIQPEPPVNSSSVYARITGTLAHLQSSNGATIGYSSTSGFDALDQKWTITADFRVIGDVGNLFPPNPLPGLNMLSVLKNAASTSNQITFSDFDVALTPQFNENSQAAIYTGPRSLVEKPPASGAPLQISYRHRLDPAVFPGAQWNVITGAGWLMSSGGSYHSNYTRDFLFYTPEVPEPASIGLLSLGLIGLIRRRAAA